MGGAYCKTHVWRISTKALRKIDALKARRSAQGRCAEGVGMDRREGGRLESDQGCAQ